MVLVTENVYVDKNGNKWVSPFLLFTVRQGNLLTKWQQHYERLGIQTKTMVKGDKTELLVNRRDDQRVYEREYVWK